MEKEVEEEFWLDYITNPKCEATWHTRTTKYKGEDKPGEAEVKIHCNCCRLSVTLAVKSNRAGSLDLAGSETARMYLQKNCGKWKQQIKDGRNKGEERMDYDNFTHR